MIDYLGETLRRADALASAAAHMAQGTKHTGACEPAGDGDACVHCGVALAKRKVELSRTLLNFYQVRMQRSPAQRTADLEGLQELLQGALQIMRGPTREDAVTHQPGVEWAQRQLMGPLDKVIAPSGFKQPGDVPL